MDLRQLHTAQENHDNARSDQGGKHAELHWLVTSLHHQHNSGLSLTEWNAYVEKPIQPRACDLPVALSTLLWSVDGILCGDALMVRRGESAVMCSLPSPFISLQGLQT